MRISSLVICSLSLWIATSVRAEVPTTTPVVIQPATTEQIQQTVDRAIGYLQTESAVRSTSASVPLAITVPCHFGH